MAKARPLILMGVLLVFLGGYLWREELSALYEEWKLPPALPGSNTISNMKVYQAPDGVWHVAFDYFYTGRPAGAMVFARQNDAPGRKRNYYLADSRRLSAERGAHHVDVPLPQPIDDVPYENVEARMIGYVRENSVTLASVKIAEKLKWPKQHEMLLLHELAGKTSEAVVARAGDLVDAGELKFANDLLRKLIERDPKANGAYVQMARLTMQANWSAEGLRQAEALLGSELQFRPDSVPARSLLGYVYTHQERYAEAQTQFEAAAASAAPTLWVWTNWGEMLSLQGKDLAASEKYLEAISRAPTGPGDDAAKRAAYEGQLALLKLRKDYKAMDALHRQRVAAYGAVDCSGVDYGRFLLQNQGEPASGVIEKVRALSAAKCHPDIGRAFVGLAQYVAWSEETGSASAELLSQARVSRPVTATLLYELAASDRTAAVIGRLRRAGESVDQLDGRKLNALAYALGNKDIEAAKRLLKQGAKPAAPVGENSMPAALIPVLARDFPGIRLMRAAGIDYAKLRLGDVTAVEMARQNQDGPLLQALDPRVGKL